MQAEQHADYTSKLPVAVADACCTVKVTSVSGLSVLSCGTSAA